MNHITQKEENENHIVEIDHSVTGLLKCTKELLEALTNWSLQSEHKERIYEQYDSLRSHFENVCHAFHAASLSMDDLLRIPEDLELCLDAALAQNPSDLECHLPSIRDTILQLLQGLKRKQALLHEKSSTVRTSPMAGTSSTSTTSGPARHLTASTSSGEFDMMDPNTQHAFTQLRDDGDLASRSSIRRGNVTDPATTENSNTSTAIQPPARRRRGLFTSPSYPVLSTPVTPPSRTASSTAPSSPIGKLITPASIQDTTKSEIVAPIAIAPSATTEITPATVADDRTSPIVLFLQWGNRTKRIVVPRPIENVTQLFDLFRCTFKDAWTGDGPTTISILDKDANIMYDLDDITLVQTNTLLSLDGPGTSTSELMKMVQQVFATQFNQWTGQLSTVSPVNSKKSPDDTSTITTLNTSSKHSGSPSVIATSTGVGTSPTNTNRDAASNRDLYQRALIDQLKIDFEHLQKVIAEHQENNQRLMTQLSDYEHQQSIQENAATITAANNKQQPNAIQNQLQEKGQLLTTRLEVLQDTIDDMKQDVTQRRCRPSPNQLDHCRQESSAILEMIRSLGNHITRSKPAWKKAWEEQLQRIVGEQQCVKEYEHLVADFEEDHAAIVTVLQHLTQVSELQKRQSSNSSKPILMSGTDNSDTGGGREGMDHVLQQLQTIDVDHDKRLDALEQAEKRRARDMANRIDDFEKELITFVDTNKLKKTGGAEQVERQQEQKTKQLLMDLYDKPGNIAT